MADYFDRLELELRAAVPRAAAYPHPHAQPDPRAAAYPHPHAQPDPRAAAYPHPHAHPDPGADADRHADPDPHAGPDPRANPRSHAHRLRAARRRPRPGNVFVAVSVAVTAAVVVLAVALVGHVHRAAHPSPPASQRPTGATEPQYTRHRISNVLTGDGIGRVRFEEPRVAVIAAVTRLLGPSSTGYTRANAVLAECGVDHTMIWPNWPVASAHGSHYPLDPMLTVWFSHSRFVGYQYGEFRNMPPPRAPSLGTVLATTRGLTIGDTFARGRKLYGAAFRTSTAQGGVFLISAPAGRIDGFAWQPRTYRGVGLGSLVATIDAGDVGCPALSP